MCDDSVTCASPISTSIKVELHYSINMARLAAPSFTCYGVGGLIELLYGAEVTRIELDSSSFCSSILEPTRLPFGNTHYYSSSPNFPLQPETGSLSRYSSTPPRRRMGRRVVRMYRYATGLNHPLSQRLADGLHRGQSSERAPEVTDDHPSRRVSGPRHTGTLILGSWFCT
jgi:hypothetical protein